MIFATGSLIWKMVADLGLVDFDTTKKLLVKIIGDKYEDRPDEISSKNEKLGLLRAMAIHELTEQTTKVFLENEEAMLSGQFDQALTDLIPCADTMNEISALSFEKIYQSKQVLEREAGGFEVIGKLMEAFTTSAYQSVISSQKATPKQLSHLRLLPETYQLKLKNETLTTYDLLMIVSDFVSSLTDSHAIKLYRTISGFSLPTAKS